MTINVYIQEINTFESPKSIRTEIMLSPFFLYCIRIEHQTYLNKRSSLCNLIHNFSSFSLQLILEQNSVSQDLLSTLLFIALQCTTDASVRPVLTQMRRRLLRRCGFRPWFLVLTIYLNNQNANLVDFKLQFECKCRQKSSTRRFLTRCQARILVIYVYFINQINSTKNPISFHNSRLVYNNLLKII